MARFANSTKNGSIVGQSPIKTKVNLKKFQKTEKGFTYDGIKNKTATSKFRSRLDRIFANFSEKRIDSISLIGEKPIKNKFFERRKVKTQLFASDHFGIVCELKMRID
ncbi:hypothetical protein MHBO_002771 [Bonamia ostreae]|uniref:Uncharacterized protein n=1 Tax=Bonamia ostreae TaxID=126728 RepID=A0ABV2ANF7_9EUKA